MNCLRWWVVWNDDLFDMMSCLRWSVIIFCTRCEVTNGAFLACYRNEDQSLLTLSLADGQVFKSTSIQVNTHLYVIHCEQSDSWKKWNGFFFKRITSVLWCKKLLFWWPGESHLLRPSLYEHNNSYQNMSTLTFYYVTMFTMFYYVTMLKCYCFKCLNRFWVWKQQEMLPWKQWWRRRSPLFSWELLRITWLW